MVYSRVGYVEAYSVKLLRYATKSPSGSGTFCANFFFGLSFAGRQCDASFDILANMVGYDSTADSASATAGGFRPNRAFI